MKFSDETESLVISVPLCYNKKPDMSAPESRRFEMEKKDQRTAIPEGRETDHRA